MIGLYSILLGATLVVCALFLLKREFQNAYFVGAKQPMTKNDMSNDSLVDSALSEMENAMVDMSEAFYDISGDLEGKYSIHEKEIDLLNEKVQRLEEKLGTQEKLLMNFKNSTRVKKQVAEPVELQEKPPQQTMNPVGEKAKEMTPHEAIAPEEVHKGARTPEESADIKGKIIGMRSQGQSLRQIAKELNMGLGEIQLILNMKR